MFDKVIAKFLKKLVKPYQVKPGDWGLDRDDDYRVRGMEDAIIAVANAIEQYNPYPSFDKHEFIKACGHSLKDLPEDWPKSHKD